MDPSSHTCHRLGIAARGHHHAPAPRRSPHRRGRGSPAQANAMHQGVHLRSEVLPAIGMVHRGVTLMEGLSVIMAALTPVLELCSRTDRATASWHGHPSTRSVDGLHSPHTPTPITPTPKEYICPPLPAPRPPSLCSGSASTRPCRSPTRPRPHGSSSTTRFCALSSSPSTPVSC